MGPRGGWPADQAPPVIVLDGHWVDRAWKTSLNDAAESGNRLACRKPRRTTLTAMTIDRWRIQYFHSNYDTSRLKIILELSLF